MPTAPDLIEAYFSVMIQERAYSYKGRLRYYLARLFRGIELAEKRVLDIGGGTGLFSFYAACTGAKEVICLEPEAQGSIPVAAERFSRIHSLLGSLSNVRREPHRIEVFNPSDGTFDVILLHNSINHLNEEACINLLHDGQSRDLYIHVLSKISSSARTGAKLIVCDWSRYNFFALLNLINPFVPDIAWHKHQSPKVWAALFSEVGFGNPEISWTSFNALRTPGRLLLGNRFMAYFLMSHFRLTMEKVR